MERPRRAAAISPFLEFQVARQAILWESAEMDFS